MKDFSNVVGAEVDMVGAKESPINPWQKIGNPR